MRTLEDFPHIINKLISLWGTKECRVYIKSLGLMEFSRIERAGFEHSAFYEVMLLLFIHDTVYPELVLTNTVEDAWSNNNELLVNNNSLQIFNDVHRDTIRLI